MAGRAVGGTSALKAGGGICRDVRGNRPAGPGERDGLVPRHRGFDGLGVTENGQIFGSEEHLDAARDAWLAAVWPRRSSVRTIWCTEGGLSWKWRCMSVS